MNSVDYSLFIFIIINVLFITNFNKIKFLHYILDKPDKEKKLHQKQMPLAGGIILIINISLYFIIVNINEQHLSKEIFFYDMFDLYVFIFTSLIIFFIGLFDDKYNLSPNYKFLFLFLAIFIALNFDDNLIITTIKISFFDRVINLNEFSLIFTCFCFLIFINAFNMFDGINLQASIYSIIILTFITIIYVNSLFIKILLIFLICYSYLNYKNKSFLGDNGSLLISFLIGYIFIKLYNNEKIIFVDEVFIYMMIPGLDLIRLVFKRIINKKNPLRGDRNHLHHLISSKFSLSKSTIIVQFLIFSPLFLLYLNVEPIFIILITICCYILLVYKMKKTS